MTADAAGNIHATAIVIGVTGLLFIGPSGSGKSACAFACLSDAVTRGLFAALVADDQVFASAHSGAIVAAAPEPTAGLVELRGSGIVRFGCLPRAVMHLAVLVGGGASVPRLPESEEMAAIGKAGSLPAVRLRESALPVLATLAALRPQLLPIGGTGAACAGIRG